MVGSPRSGRPFPTVATTAVRDPADDPVLASRAASEPDVPDPFDPVDDVVAEQVGATGRVDVDPVGIAHLDEVAALVGQVLAVLAGRVREQLPGRDEDDTADSGGPG